MRILLVDDQVLFREGVFGLINAQPNLEVVGEAGSVAEAIAQARKLHPDLILMDFSLPDGTGLDATRAILGDLPEIKIVFLTFHDDDTRLFDAIRAGGKGYLLKNVSTSKLLTYLREVGAGGAALTPSMTSRLVHEFARLEPQSKSHRGAASELTTRELDVLQILVTGASNREIAGQLVISENTVKNHMRNILAKLNLKNRREAAEFAKRNGLA